MNRPQHGGPHWLTLGAVVLAAALALVLLQRGTTSPPVQGASDPQLGRRVYANCQACHGLDGRGIAGYAPGLIAAPTLAGDGQAAVAKILLGGQRIDGFNAVMPGFSRLSDLEVAAVMTYVRSSWGNTGTPVDAATVNSMRRRLGDPRSLP